MSRPRSYLRVAAIALLAMGLAVATSSAQEAATDPGAETKAESEETTADADNTASKNADKSSDATDGATPLLSFDSGELALLRRLAVRRRELEAWEARLIERERLAEAIELALDEQAAELRRLKADIAKRQAKIDAAEKAEEQKDVDRLKNLAKAYQSMKPRDAARLFNEMDLKLLTDIAREIAPRTLAPMMSRMSAERARELTEALRKG